jgi:hypothetical protein
MLHAASSSRTNSVAGARAIAAIIAEAPRSIRSSELNRAAPRLMHSSGLSVGSGEESLGGGGGDRGDCSGGVEGPASGVLALTPASSRRPRSLAGEPVGSGEESLGGGGGGADGGGAGMSAEQK